jgi:hypothetical protein
MIKKKNTKQCKYDSKGRESIYLFTYKADPKKHSACRILKIWLNHLKQLNQTKKISNPIKLDNAN